MSLLRIFFRSHKKDADAPARLRPPWPRVRRSQSAADVLGAHLQRIPADGDASWPRGHETSAPASSRSTPTLLPEDHHPSGHEGLVDTEPARESNDSSEASQRHLRGSSRFRDVMKRFRPNKSHERGSLSEAFQPSEQADIGEVQNTDPVKKGPLSKVEVSGELVVQQQSRQVSTHTVRSQESAITVCRYPSQRVALPMQDLGEDWSLGAHLTIDQVSREKTHRPEVSDPFSDGKIAGSSRRDYTSSRYSEDPLQGPSEVSGQSYTESSFQLASVRSHSEQSHHGSHYHLHGRSVSERERISSLGSESSGRSRLNRLDPARARVAFNETAAQLNFSLRIPAGKHTTAEVTQENVDAGNSPQRRHRFLGGLRPVQSIMGLAKASQAAPAATPKLRRSKTFADLLRRPEPMTSLRGIEVERLARLGGNSFLVLPPSLVPCPVQLPASIVASIGYLRKFGNGTCGGNLFVEPGNLKKAIRLYDYFAHHVLSAANDEHEIALNMRVFTMPTWANAEKMPVLSVGWTLKALLAGMPGGILGSTELYNTLKGIYHLQGAVVEAIPQTFRARLISLAIVASTSEMQCAVICAIFGLLTELLEADSRESDAAGDPLREVASTSRAEGLARVFGPLLTRTETGPGTGMEATVCDREDAQVKEAAQVKREIDAERVAGMLLEYWPNVSYHLKGWAKVYTTVLAEYV